MSSATLSVAVRFATLGAALALALLAPPPAPALETPVANPPLATVPLALVTRTGRHRYTVETARTETEQARGLMQRKAMPRDHGMIFPMDPPREATFWMEGTILPLDIVFIAPDRTVLTVAADAVPFSRATIPSHGIVGAVLELNAGEAKRIGLAAGDRVDYRLP